MSQSGVRLMLKRLAKQHRRLAGPAQTHEEQAEVGGHVGEVRFQPQGDLITCGRAVQLAGGAVGFAQVAVIDGLAR